MTSLPNRPLKVVVKIGTSSITGTDGEVDTLAIDKLCTEVVNARRGGHQVVIVTSGAVTAGVQVLGIPRPADVRTLQAVSAVGQVELMRVFRELLDRYGVVMGQALLAPLDFMVRQQYLHARSTIERLLEMGVVPIINENDAIADDEFRFGDNDRLAALVANLIDADLLLLLTDAPGLLTADPRRNPDASLIEEVFEIDRELEEVAGGASEKGSGGMSSKLAAAKMARWSGVRAVIAGASRPGVVADAIEGRPGVGTVVQPRDRKLQARKLWIAFAVHSEGRIVVDAGARLALTGGARSLLPAGVKDVIGEFASDAAVEIADEAGDVFGKGIVRASAVLLRSVMGLRTDALPDGLVHETVHRDDLVVLVDH
ncbi:MAG: glutamate 5-kinase [Actinobacteria bacterium]|nr:glutamate 5-kinase [Actinomycetota bacterium]